MATKTLAEEYFLLRTNAIQRRRFQNEQVDQILSIFKSYSKIDIDYGSLGIPYLFDCLTLNLFIAIRGCAI